MPAASGSRSPSCAPASSCLIEAADWPKAIDELPRRRDDGHGTFAIFTMLPFACGSLGSFTTVTQRDFPPSPNATLVVPSPAAIGKTCSSRPSGEIFSTFPPDHWATYMLPLGSIFMLSGPSHQDLTLSGVSRLSRAKFDLWSSEPSPLTWNFRMQLPTVSLT